MTEANSENPEASPGIRPRLVSRKKKTVFVFSKGSEEEDEDGFDEGDDLEDSFYDFSEIEIKFRIINDLDD